MNNFTFTSLFLKNHISNSPLFIKSPLKSNLNLFFSKSCFHKITNSILFGQSSQNYTFYQSSFSNILNSAIVIVNSDEYSNNEFHTQQILSKTELNVDHCEFTYCLADRGACILGTGLRIYINNSIFSHNTANVGGAILCNLSQYITYNKVLFFNNTAKYSAASHTDAAQEKDLSKLRFVNTTRNHAELWSGGLRIDRAGGSLFNCVFDSNHAFASGAFFDFSYRTTLRVVTYNFYHNNSAQVRSGAFTCFHVMHNSTFNNCIFVLNKCVEQAHSISLESVDQRVTIGNCYFDGPQQEQVSMRFGDSFLNILDTNRFNRTINRNNPLAKFIEENFSQKEEEEIETKNELN